MPVHPEVTERRPDPRESRGFVFSTPLGSGDATGADAAAVTSDRSEQRTGTMDSATTPTTDAASAPTQEAVQRERLGVLIVQLGGAPEEKVFGSVNSPVMQAYRTRRTPELLVINRREDDAAAHPLVWYNPLTWFTSGPQVSPLRWSAEPSPPRAGTRHGQASASNVEASATTVAGVEATTQTEAAQVIVPPVASLLAEAAATATAEKKRKKKKSGLPPVVMNPLSEEEVEHQLTSQVRADREKLLTSEERIHKVLQGIEDTRYKYLVPSQDLSCEREVHDVVVCYQKQNAAAEKKRAAMMEKRKQELAKGFSNQVDDEDIDVPIVFFDALACGVKVDALRVCTAKMVSVYSHDGLE